MFVVHSDFGRFGGVMRDNIPEMWGVVSMSLMAPLGFVFKGKREATWRLRDSANHKAVRISAASILCSGFCQVLEAHLRGVFVLVAFRLGAGAGCYTRRAALMRKRCHAKNLGLVLGESVEGFGEGTL